jgi:hypothetical protein
MVANAIFGLIHWASAIEKDNPLVRMQASNF